MQVDIFESMRLTSYLPIWDPHNAENLIHSRSSFALRGDTLEGQSLGFLGVASN